MTMNKPTIPVFFAADENYLPFLSVTLHSLKENASRDYHYDVYILHSGMDLAKTGGVKKYEDEDFSVYFTDVSSHLEEVKNTLQLRDYYTGATYYRIFIANLFPQYDKAIYLDSDIVLLDDISKMYNIALEDALVGAVADGAVAIVPAFRRYTKEVLGIDAENYFNAGVLLMNLKRFRETDFYGQFCQLLKNYKFSVAQDQDYLNVLCKDSVVFLDETWNKMPIGGANGKPCLIHYNLTMKPWHYKGTLYEEYFWEYAKKTEYYEVIHAHLSAYSHKEKQRDADTEKGLIELCIKECERADNYYKVYCKN